MKLEGSHDVPAPRQKVWDAFLDPEQLRQAIPGCEKLEALGNDEYKATMKVGVGGVKGTFEGKVRGRLAGADKPAAMVVATKPTRALPVVGAVSALILLVIGYLLGGWVVAFATGVFALFIFGVALAGTRTTKDRLDHRRSKGLAPTMEPTEPVPRVVADAITRIEELV